MNTREAARPRRAQKSSSLALAACLAPCLSGCAVVGDVFKAGVGVGVFFAVIAGLAGAGIILMAVRH